MTAALTRRPRPVRRLAPGRWGLDGYYREGVETLGSVVISLQPATPSDYQKRAESEPGGDRVSGLMVGYTALEDALTPSGKDGKTGDLVQHEGRWWLCVAVSRRDVLAGSPVCHARHLLALQPAEAASLPDPETPPDVLTLNDVPVTLGS